MNVSTVVITEELRAKYYNALIVQIAKWKHDLASVVTDLASNPHSAIHIENILNNANEFRVLLDMTGCKITFTKSDIITLYELLEATHE